MVDNFYNTLQSMADTSYATLMSGIDALKIKSLSFYNWTVAILPTAFERLKELPSVYGPKINELIKASPTYEDLVAWVEAFPDVYGYPALAALKASPASIKTYATVKGPLAIQWIKTSPSVYGPIFVNWCQTTPLAVNDWVRTVAIPYIMEISWLTWWFAFMTIAIDFVIIFKAYYDKPFTVPTEFLELFGLAGGDQEKNIHHKMNPFAFEPKAGEGDENSHRTKSDKCPFGFGKKDKDGEVAEMPEGHPKVSKPEEAAE